MKWFINGIQFEGTPFEAREFVGLFNEPVTISTTAPTVPAVEQQSLIEPTEIGPVTTGKEVFNSNGAQVSEKPRRESWRDQLTGAPLITAVLDVLRTGQKLSTVSLANQLNQPVNRVSALMSRAYQDGDVLRDGPFPAPGGGRGYFLYYLKPQTTVDPNESITNRLLASAVSDEWLTAKALSARANCTENQAYTRLGNLVRKELLIRRSNASTGLFEYQRNSTGAKA